MLSNIPIPVYNSTGRDAKKALIVNEFAGRLILEVREVNKLEEIKITVEVTWEDLQRGWEAVKKY